MGKQDGAGGIQFQSTPSTQRETEYSGRNLDSIISIHSLYAEGDVTHDKQIVTGGDFNPLPLRRGRQK